MASIISLKRWGSKRGAVLSALIFIAFGLIVLFYSHADTPTVSLEAENGTLGGAASIVSDSSASGGRAVQFGQQATSGGTFYLGAAVEPDQLTDPAFVAALLKYKFNSLTAENAMKMDASEPNQGQFNFAPGDQIVDFALAHGMRVRGHTLVWYQQLPNWVYGLSDADAASALKNHIQTMMTHYKGKIHIWDVVNEALSDDYFAPTLRTNSVWEQKIGDSYVADSFEWAHEADPTAELCYNDYNIEASDTADGNTPAKLEAAFNLVKGLKDQGVPIDCVGFQTHVTGPLPGPGQGPTGIEATIKRYAAIGIKVEITELDIPTMNNDRVAQANRYAEIGTACKDSGDCSAITTWGLYDGHTWRTGTNPLLLDTSYNPKPSYCALLNSIGMSIPAGVTCPSS